MGYLDTQIDEISASAHAAALNPADSGELHLAWSRLFRKI